MPIKGEKNEAQECHPFGHIFSVEEVSSLLDNKPDG